MRTLAAMWRQQQIVARELPGGLSRKRLDDLNALHGHRARRQTQDALLLADQRQDGPRIGWPRPLLGMRRSPRRRSDLAEDAVAFAVLSAIDRADPPARTSCTSRTSAGSSWWKTREECGCSTILCAPIGGHPGACAGPGAGDGAGQPQGHRRGQARPGRSASMCSAWAAASTLRRWQTSASGWRRRHRGGCGGVGRQRVRSAKLLAGLAGAADRAALVDAIVRIATWPGTRRSLKRTSNPLLVLPEGERSRWATGSSCRHDALPRPCAAAACRTSADCQAVARQPWRRPAWRDHVSRGRLIFLEGEPCAGRHVVVGDHVYRYRPMVRSRSPSRGRGRDVQRCRGARRRPRPAAGLVIETNLG